MNAKTRTLIDEARKLTADERIELAEAIMVSLDEPEIDVDAAWTAEVEDRIAAHERGDMAARPASEVLGKYRR